MTAQELADLLELVNEQANKDPEKWDRIFWELVTYKTEEEK